MKFTIHRTSRHGFVDEEKSPCAGAVLEVVGDSEAWTIEVGTLRHLIRLIGDLSIPHPAEFIVSVPSTKHGLPDIEIYDDMRE